MIMIKMNLEVLTTLGLWKSCDFSATVQHKHHIIVHTSANFIQIHTYTTHMNTRTILIHTRTIHNTCTIHVINTYPISSSSEFITSSLSGDCNGCPRKIYMRKTTSITQSHLVFLVNFGIFKLS